jgi:AbrB family looped-hinge helix DNA binding protein
MVTVDSKGRVVLPKAVRERLGITPGSEVEVREEDGRVVVEPESDPERVIERMDRLVEETAPDGETRPLDSDVPPAARKHRERVRQGAESGDE